LEKNLQQRSAEEEKEATNVKAGNYKEEITSGETISTNKKRGDQTWGKSILSGFLTLG